MNLREAVKAEISPAANRRRVNAYRTQDGGPSYIAATSKAGGSRHYMEVKKIIEARQALH